MIEDDVLPARLRAAPRRCRRMRQVSYDLTLRRPLELADGTHDHRARDAVGATSTGPSKYAEDRGLECRRRARSATRCCARWEAVLTGLETDPMSLADQLDWVAKYRLIDGYRERHGLDWDDARLAAMDLQYHDLRPEQVAVRTASGSSG